MTGSRGAPVGRRRSAVGDRVAVVHRDNRDTRGQDAVAGAFRSYEHATSGRARVIATADGRRYVRFEDFETSNGPALKVYLSAAPASGPGDSFDDRFVDLGDLKGNIGSQNYTIPADVRLDRYRSVVVWCKRFSVPFAAAPL